jgi:hypothetical protein
MRDVSSRAPFKQSRAECRWIHYAVQTLMPVSVVDRNLRFMLRITEISNLAFFPLNRIIITVAVGTASECLNEWADEDAGIEAVQKIIDTLDDIAALQDTEIDPDVLISMLRDNKLHTMLQVG